MTDASRRPWYVRDGMQEDEYREVVDWPTVESSQVGNTEFVLGRHGDDWVVRRDRQVLMTNRVHWSEIELARQSLDLCEDPRSFLVGGLGLGYTLRAALDRMPANSQVTVVELVPEVVDWNRRLLTHLNGSPLDDPRCEVITADVFDFILHSKRTWDVIVLDVDNGPQALSQAKNQRLYTEGGTRALYEALSPEGVLGVWSAGPNAKYAERLRKFGFELAEVKSAARQGGREWHMLFLGKKRPRSGPVSRDPARAE